jgi:hypothetical protein
MTKIDYKKELKEFYNPSAKGVTTVSIPPFNFLMIDGKGDPNTSVAYKEAIEALYAVSYTLKFKIKRRREAIDYGVMPLESLWWSDDKEAFDVKNKDNWKWTAMIMQPPLVTTEFVEVAMLEVQQKKDLPALSKMRFESFAEGESAQIMHIGPFSEEGPNIKKVHDFIKTNGHTLRGKHHEIYLSDIRRATPEKWKTIIRQPFS